MNDEHTIAIISEHGAIVRMVDRVRRKLAIADQSYMSLRIEVSGQVDKKPTMSYNLQISSYGETVTGNDLNEVLAESLRRVGWKEKNKPLELTFENNGDTPTEDKSNDY